MRTCDLCIPAARKLVSCDGMPQPLPGGASLPFLGKLRPNSAAEVEESSVSIGFE